MLVKHIIWSKDYSEEEKYEQRLKRIFTEHGSRMVGVETIIRKKFDYDSVSI